MSGPYRPNVCAVITDDSQSKVLMFRRVDVSSFGWQFPQGGIDYGETPIQALVRELKEEIGTNEVRCLQQSSEWIYYDFPEWSKKTFKPRPNEPEYVGQKQHWFLLQLHKGLSSISFDYEPAEFDQYEWVMPQAVPERIIDFKRDAYTQGLKALGFELT